jgi:hypothetical protein
VLHLQQHFNYRVRIIFLSIICQFFVSAFAQAQPPVSVMPAEKQRVQTPPGIWPMQNWLHEKASEAQVGKPFRPPSDNWKLYLALGVLLVFGVCRRVFEKYYTDMTGLVFRSTLKGRQIKEQMQNTPLPSMVFNLFFAVTAGLFIFLLLWRQNRLPAISPVALALLCMAAVLAVYAGKYLGLKFFGWIFNSAETTNTYIFVVFYINKIIGILLVPVVVLLLLSGGQLADIVMVVSLLGVGVLFLYRYLLAYSPAARAIQIPAFHFFLYICSVEIVPLLLIYKVLFQLADNKL